MKRTLAALLTAAMMLCMTACGSGSDSDKSSAEPSGTSTSQPGGGDSTAEIPEEEPKNESAGDLGDYHVEIKGARLAKDYEDKPVIIITYAWTNNSDETDNAMFSVNGKAFQDGVGLEAAIVGDSEVYDSGASMTDVRPGTTIDVQCAYVLTSETSVVEFEMTELISFNDNMVSAVFDPAAL